MDGGELRVDYDIVPRPTEVRCRSRGFSRHQVLREQRIEHIGTDQEVSHAVGLGFRVPERGLVNDGTAIRERIERSPGGLQIPNVVAVLRYRGDLTE